MSRRNIECRKKVVCYCCAAHVVQSTAYRRCVAFLVFVSVSKLGHPAKLEQRDVINAYAVDGNHGLRMERKTGAACGGEEVS